MKKKPMTLSATVSVRRGSLPFLGGDGNDTEKGLYPVTMLLIEKIADDNGVDRACIKPFLGVLQQSWLGHDGPESNLLKVSKTLTADRTVSELSLGLESKANDEAQVFLRENKKAVTG